MTSGGGKEYVCPITLDPIQDPACTLCGSVYEREALMTWFAKMAPSSDLLDPLTRLPLPAVEWWVVDKAEFEWHVKSGTVTSDLRCHLTHRISEGHHTVATPAVPPPSAHPVICPRFPMRAVHLALDIAADADVRVQVRHSDEWGCWRHLSRSDCSVDLEVMEGGAVCVMVTRSNCSGGAYLSVCQVDGVDVFSPSQLREVRLTDGSELILAIRP